MIRKLFFVLMAAYLAFAAWWVLRSGFQSNGGQVELLNVACDPTRELWRDINDRFITSYANETGTNILIRQSHGGSGSQARAVIDGLQADVITLALFTDTDAVRKANLIDADWVDKLPNRSLPFTSTIVFVVRKGNPKNIREWSDLSRPDVSVITPNPKTSGNGKWSFLGMWGAAIRSGLSDAQAEVFVTQIFRNVPLLDPSARAATMTFAQKNIGDVHLTWENEAYLEVKESKNNLEIVYPSKSIIAEPHVAVVDRVVEQKETKKIAEAYLKYLYRPESQDVIASHFYRPVTIEAQKKHADKFPPIQLFSVREIGTSWEEINRRFFVEGTIFDRIFATGVKK